MVRPRKGCTPCPYVDPQTKLPCNKNGKRRDGCAMHSPSAKEENRRRAKERARNLGKEGLKERKNKYEEAIIKTAEEVAQKKVSEAFEEKSKLFQQMDEIVLPLTSMRSSSSLSKKEKDRKEEESDTTSVMSSSSFVPSISSSSSKTIKDQKETESESESTHDTSTYCDEDEEEDDSEFDQHEEEDLSCLNQILDSTIDRCNMRIQELATASSSSSDEEEDEDD